MFVLSDKETYTWPVEHSMPKDGGKYEKVKFNIEFNRLPQSRLDVLKKEAENDEIDDNVIVEEILAGWSGIKTSTGDDFDYSEANKVILLEISQMRTSIIAAYFRSIRGAPRKN